MENTSLNEEQEAEQPGLVLDQQTFNWRHRNALKYILITFYTLPVSLFCFYANYMYPAFRSWGYVFFGLTFCGIGTLILFTLLRNWELYMKAQVKECQPLHIQDPLPVQAPIEETIEVQHISPEEIENISTPFLEEISSLKSLLETKEMSYQKEIENFSIDLGQTRQSYVQLEEELIKKRKEVTTLGQEKREYYSKCEHLEKELLATKEHYQKLVEEKRQLLKQKEEIVLRQKLTLDRSTQERKHLEERVTDLNFELKTVLQLDALNLSLENHQLPSGTLLSSPPKIEKPSKYNKLRECLEIMYEMQGGHCLTSEQNFAPKHTVVDLRRLKDKLEHIDSCLTLLYSPTQGRLLYANSIVKEYFQLTPERFIHDFKTLIANQEKDWIHTIEEVKKIKEKDFPLYLKDKQGEEYPFDARVALVTTGLFKNNILIVAMPQEALKESN